MTKWDWVKYWVQRGWWIGSGKRARERRAMAGIEIIPLKNTDCEFFSRMEAHYREISGVEPPPEDWCDWCGD